MIHSKVKISKGRVARSNKPFQFVPMTKGKAAKLVMGDAVSVVGWNGQRYVGVVTRKPILRAYGPSVRVAYNNCTVEDFTAVKGRRYMSRLIVPSSPRGLDF